MKGEEVTVASCSKGNFDQTEGNYFVMRDKWWNSLPRDVFKSLLLDIFKSWPEQPHLNLRLALR